MGKGSEKIVTDADGFQLVGGKGKPVCVVRFDDIVRAEAYKRDELTTDLICLDVFLANGMMVWVHEDLAGFEDLAAQLVKTPGLDPNWRGKVVQPPFAECRTVVYDRG